MLTEDLNPRAYIFSSCNEKIKAIVVQSTTTESKMNYEARGDWFVYFPGFKTHQG